jgi:diaminopimelate epimerase
MQIEFEKFQGTGNDFILLDNRDGRYSDLDERTINWLCDRRLGVGADGLMLLQVVAAYDFEMKYYNADGRESSMCGNGGRCIAAYAKRLGIGGRKVKFLAIDGEHEALFLDNGQVQLQMSDVEEIHVEPSHYFLNTGSPHHVSFVEDVDEIDVYTLGKATRYSDEYKPGGTNVNFVSWLGDGIRVRTYERGVEDETWSCGTGVTAAAICAGIEKGVDKMTCGVSTLGGKLSVSFHRVSEQKVQDIWLQGPVEFVYQGIIHGR